MDKNLCVYYWIYAIDTPIITSDTSTKHQLSTKYQLTGRPITIGNIGIEDSPYTIDEKNDQLNNIAHKIHLNNQELLAFYSNNMPTHNTQVNYSIHPFGEFMPQEKPLIIKCSFNEEKIERPLNGEEIYGLMANIANIRNSQ